MFTGLSRCSPGCGMVRLNDGSRLVLAVRDLPHFYMSLKFCNCTDFASPHCMYYIVNNFRSVVIRPTVIKLIAFKVMTSTEMNGTT